MGNVPHGKCAPVGFCMDKILISFYFIIYDLTWPLAVVGIFLLKFIRYYKNQFWSKFGMDQNLSIEHFANLLYL